MGIEEKEKIKFEVTSVKTAPEDEVRVDALVMPLMLGYGAKHETKIPFAMLNEEQAQTNHGQTLKRLAECGGLAACEALAIMDKRRWRHMDAEESLAVLVKRIENHEA